MLDHGLKLLVRQLFEQVPVLDLVLARHQQSEDLEICRRLRPAHLRNGLLPMHGEIPQQRANYRLAQPITRAAQSSGSPLPGGGRIWALARIAGCARSVARRVDRFEHYATIIE